MPRKSKAATAKEAVEFVSSAIRCGWCSKLETYDRTEMTFSASVEPCDICGSHGHIRLWLVCKNCKKTVEIDLETW